MNKTIYAAILTLTSSLHAGERIVFSLPAGSSNIIATVNRVRELRGEPGTFQELVQARIAEELHAASRTALPWLKAYEEELAKIKADNKVVQQSDAAKAQEEAKAAIETAQAQKLEADARAKAKEVGDGPEEAGGEGPQ